MADNHTDADTDDDFEQGFGSGEDWGQVEDPFTGGDDS